MVLTSFPVPLSCQLPIFLTIFHIYLLLPIYLSTPVSIISPRTSMNPPPPVRPLALTFAVLEGTGSLPLHDDVGQRHSVGGQNSGVFVNQNGADPQSSSDLAGVLTPGSTETRQGVAGRIVTFSLRTASG